MTKHPHSVQYRIYYEDTDAEGVVYYANYLKFAERARTEYLRTHNIHQSQLKEQQDTIFAVKEVAMKCRRPARLDDLITVTTTVEKISGASLIMAQTISKNHTIAEITVHIACINSAFKPKKIPENVRKSL